MAFTLSYKTMLLSLLIASILTGRFSITIQKNITVKVQTDTAKSLHTVLNTTEQAVKSWLREHKAAVNLWANSPEIRQSAIALSTISDNKSALISSAIQTELESPKKQ